MSLFLNGPRSMSPSPGIVHFLPVFRTDFFHPLGIFRPPWCTTFCSFLATFFFFLLFGLECSESRSLGPDTWADFLMTDCWWWSLLATFVGLCCFTATMARVVLALDVVEAATITTNYCEKENEKNLTSFKTFKCTVPAK